MKKVMKHRLDWIEKFIAPDKQKELALATSENQFEALCLLIEAGKIDVTAYLSWASQNYLLPSLDSQFFAQVDLQSIWKKYSGLTFWTADTFPVGEYENRVMIATFAPPTDFTASFPEPPMFVLASPIDLKQTWKKLSPKVATPHAPQAPIPLPPQAPPQVKVSAPAPAPAPHPAPAKNSVPENSMRFNMTMDENFKAIDLSAITPEKSEEVALNVEEKSVEKTHDSGELNLDLDLTKSVVPQFSFGAPKPIAPPVQATAPAPVPVPIRQAAPPTTPPPPPAPPVAQVASPVQTAKPAATPPEKPVAPSTPLSPKPPVMQETLKPISASAQTPPPPQPKAPPVLQTKPVGPPPQSKPVGPPTKAVPLQSATPVPPPIVPPAPAVKLAPTPLAQQPKALSFKSQMKRDLSQTKSSFDECSTYAQASDVMFSKMIPQFEMSMLLLIEDQNLKPAYWSGDFKIFDEQKPNLIALQQASIFKIVYASGKPYHGYLVANHTNNKFFAEWNSGEIPKHVTIFPIFVNKDLVGMWFGATNNPIDLKTSFSDMDSLTDQSVAAFQKLIQSAA